VKELKKQLLRRRKRKSSGKSVSTYGVKSQEGSPVLKEENQYIDRF
jgi:hypothetical protein